MGNRASFALASAALLNASPALADDDFQQWLTVSARGEIAPKIMLQTEGIARFSNQRAGLYQMQGIANLGYVVAEGVTVWGGFVESLEYARRDVTVERRAREQITFDNFAKLGTVAVSGRLRFEQRWRDGVGGTAWRVRPYARISVPLGGKQAPSVLLSSELFYNLNEVPFQARDGLDRVRSAAALSIPISPKVRADVGYLNQHRFVPRGADVDEHALTLALGFSF